MIDSASAEQHSAPKDEPSMPPMWADVPGERVNAPIREVVVLEDRAQVARQVTLDLEAGNHRLVIAGVTPLVVDRTLRCRIRDLENDQTAARVLDLQTTRRYVVRPARPEREREIREALRLLLSEYREVVDEMHASMHERRLIELLATRVTQHIRDRLAIGEFDDAWPDVLRETADRRVSLEKQILQAQWAQDDRGIEYDRLLAELGTAVQPVADYQAALLTELSVPASSRLEITWEYLVPCALWRPAYTARLEEEATTAVHWTSTGTVWQATGEDWRDVALSFSTARPTLGADLPLLYDDVLQTREKTNEEKKTIQVTSRDQIISVTSSLLEEKQSSTPPGLDDGGETRTYRVPGRVDVFSDGRPHRLTFETWQAECKLELRCVPEKAEFVFLQSSQTNGSSLPLLAGPVGLIRKGGFVGRSQIALVAAKERFALSWGSEDDLVVLRDVVHEHAEKGLRKHHHHRFALKVYLANQTTHTRHVRLIERVPVSELEQVHIEIHRAGTTHGFSTNDQGLVSWEIALQPGGEEIVELDFEVAMPKNIQWQ